MYSIFFLNIKKQGMKGKLVITVAIIFVFITAFVMAAGVSGNWTGIMTMSGGRTATFHYIFKTDNNTLTGSVEARGNNKYELSNGKIYGDSLSFSVVVDNGDSIQDIGKYYPDGDSIKLDAVFMGATMHGILKRDSQGSIK
jgi:hypothetical protein